MYTQWCQECPETTELSGGIISRLGVQEALQSPTPVEWKRSPVLDEPLRAATPDGPPSPWRTPKTPSHTTVAACIGPEVRRTTLRSSHLRLSSGGVWTDHGTPFTDWTGDPTVEDHEGRSGVGRGSGSPKDEVVEDLEISTSGTPPIKIEEGLE